MDNTEIVCNLNVKVSESVMKDLCECTWMEMMKRVEPHSKERLKDCSFELICIN